MRRRDRQLQIAVLLVALYFVCGVWGWHAALYPYGTPLHFWLSVTAAMLAAGAALHLADLRGRSIPVLSRWILLAVWPVAVPVFLMWSYGRRAALLVVLGAFGILVAYVGGAIVAVSAAAFLGSFSVRP